MMRVDPCPAVLDRGKVMKESGVYHVYPIPCGQDIGHEGLHRTADGWQFANDFAIWPTRGDGDR